MEPIVSISCLAYNHEKYIKEAIEGFLLQITSFPFEVILHDDASTDSTATIIQEYALRYPELIFPIFQNENQYSKGINPGIEFVVPKCKGKYIATCEGDDYWTDPYKLQKQVDFLERNPEYGLISSDVNLINDKSEPLPDNNMVIKQREYYKPTINVFDLLKINRINTLTVCVRTNLMQELSERVVKENLWYVYDYWFWLQISLMSKIYISDEKVANYRIHKKGVSQQSDFFSKRKPLLLRDIFRTGLSIKTQVNLRIKLKILYNYIITIMNYALGGNFKGFKLLIFGDE